MKNKAFGIGMPRTGTTTLTEIFKKSGYKSIHFPSKEQYSNIRGFDFACDQPICVRYKELYAKFPGANFIYTERNMDQWLDSNEKWFQQYNHKGPLIMEYRMETFGIPGFKRDVYKEVYLKHKEDVLSFFKDKKLTVLSICDKTNLEALWAITGKKLDHLPQLNKTI